MHYTILVFSCPYICFGTPCAIIRGVVKSSQFSSPSNSLSQQKFTVTEYHLSYGTIWYNKICIIEKLTPKYIHVTVNGKISDIQ
jgi:hypothetical protein